VWGSPRPRGASALLLPQHVRDVSRGAALTVHELRSIPTTQTDALKSVTIRADTSAVSMRRALKWLVALIVVGATLVATGPTIWENAILNVQTYLHTSKEVARTIILVPVGVILLIVALVRATKWIRVWRHHRAARHDALRNLRV
jgi:hypothetical protein